jgi:hypothetical protein
METKVTACDLMVGDWVYSTFSDKPCKVQAIELSEHGYGSVRVTGVDGVKDIVSLSPIPLTAEVLEKNNFEKHYDDDIIIYTHPQGIIIEMGINYKLFDDGHFFVRGILKRFYFVHELQRALKLLKINKDIVL